MKTIVPFFAILLLLNACERQKIHEAPRTDGIASKLPGVWVAHAVSSSGSVIDSTLEIARHGSYASTATFHTRRNGIRYYESQGFFLIDGGLLFVETNSSVTNASLPNTNRLQIIRITDEELVFKSEEPLPPGTTPDPEQIVFHRQRK